MSAPPKKRKPNARRTPKKEKNAYALAGVDIDEMMTGLDKAKRAIESTLTPGVLRNWGAFGGLHESPGKGTVLVSSIDGVGTKLKVAHLAGRHNTVGQDLVNHCVNDILVQGARPLFFLDYVGAAKLSAKVFAEVVGGMAKACRENGCALIGGETAEMPGLYPEGEYDLVGAIVGVVDKKNLIDGASIRDGDVLIGLPSSGLHTNGFSLARHVLFEKAGLDVNDILPGTNRSVADVLLAVHRSYLKPVGALLDKVKVQGLVHITGGGFWDNLPRILPDGVSAVVDPSTWQPPPVFRFLEFQGWVDRREMFRVFNMGIGMVVVVREDHAVEAVEILKKHRAQPRVIGWIEKGDKPVRILGIE